MLMILTANGVTSQQQIVCSLFSFLFISFVSKPTLAAQPLSHAAVTLITNMRMRIVQLADEMPQTCSGSL